MVAHLIFLNYRPNHIISFVFLLNLYYLNQLRFSQVSLPQGETFLYSTLSDKLGSFPLVNCSHLCTFTVPDMQGVVI